VATPVSNVIYDGFGDFAAGMDSGVAPTLLPKNQMGYAANVTVRGGFATDRPAWRRIGLNFGGDLGLQTLFENALWQGAENYQPDVGLESLICSIGGQLFNIIPDAKGNATVANISIPGDPNPVNQPQAWLKQAENFMIVNDGASLPLLYDGSTTRRSIGGQEIILGTTSLNFLVPAIGAEGTATLIGPFLGYFGETVLIGGATYQVIAPPNSNLPAVQNIDAASGTIYPGGTVVYYDPNIAAVYTTPPVGPISIPDGTVFALGLISVSPPYTGPIGATVNWPPQDSAFYNWKVMGADTTSISLKLNLFSSPGGTLTAPTGVAKNTLMVFKPGGAPLQNVGTLSTPFTAPPVDGNGTLSFVNQYTGPLPAILSINGDHYIITAAGSGTPTNSIILLNINDTVGTPGTTPPSITAPASIYSIPELPAGRMLAYGMGRVWEVMTDSISFLAGDIVGGSSGSPNLNFRDAVLKITENLYLAGGGLFRVPGSVGEIRGLIFTATLDVSLGQGPLQVFTSRNVFSCQAPVDRTTWQSLTNPILTEALKGAGGAGQYTLTNSNADVLFRSPDGQIRSLILSRLDFNRWGDTPISLELLRVTEQENLALMNFDSGIVFDNRRLSTANPVQTAQGVVWSNLFALNFDEISSLQNKSASVYDGVWGGLKIFQLVRFSGSNRAFAFCSDTGSGIIELWELLPTGDEHLDSGILPITWQFESPTIFMGSKQKGLFDLARLVDGEIYLSDIEGRVDVTVEYRPDWSPCWYPWASFYVCSAVGPGLENQYRSRIGLGEPSASQCVQFNNKPAREARFFQLRLTFTGHCVFQGAKLGAVLVPEYEFEPPLCNKTGESGPITTPVVFNDLVFFQISCPVGTPAPIFGVLPRPNWIYYDFSNNQLVGNAGLFRGDSKAAANTVAQKTLDLWANQAVAAGYFVCLSPYNILKDDEQTSLLGTDAMQLRYLNGKYFLTRSSVNGIFSSTDGLTWTNPLAGASGLIYDVAYGSGFYVAVGAQLTVPFRCIVYKSLDGIAWTEHDDLVTVFPSYSVCFGGGSFCRFDNFGHPVVSADGVNWTAYGSVQGSTSCRKVQYLNGKFYACFADNVWSASNPAGVWTQGAFPAGYECRDIAFGNNTYVAVGFYSSGGNHSWTAVSSDGISWTVGGTLGVAESALVGVVFANGSFVACGQSGNVYFSSNGNAWIPGSTTAAAALNNIVTDGQAAIITAEGTLW
jgi:hypothetical protein